MGCHFLLQGVFLTQGSNLGLLRCKQNLYGLSHHTAAAAAAKSLQSCPPLCDPIDGSPPGSSIPGILQARTLEWVAISLCCEKLSNLAEKGLLVSIRKIINT